MHSFKSYRPCYCPKLTLAQSNNIVVLPRKSHLGSDISKHGFVTSRPLGPPFSVYIPYRANRSRIVLSNRLARAGSRGLPEFSVSFCLQLVLKIISIDLIAC